MLNALKRNAKFRRRLQSKEGLRKIVPDDKPYSVPEEEGEEGVSYEGAHVFTPKTLGLFKLLLLCLDFASLYPSILIALNLGHDTAGTARRMRKKGVNLADCFKTPRRFPVPKLKGEEGLLTVQRVLAAKHRQEAEAGMKLQLPDGTWTTNEAGT